MKYVDLTDLILNAQFNSALFYLVGVLMYIGYQIVEYMRFKKKHNVRSILRNQSSKEDIYAKH